MPWYAWLLVGWLVFGGLASVAFVGRPVKPLTGEGALLRLVIAALMIWAVVSLAT